MLPKSPLAAHYLVFGGTVGGAFGGTYASENLQVGCPQSQDFHLYLVPPFLVSVANLQWLISGATSAADMLESDGRSATQTRGGEKLCRKFVDEEDS